MDGATPGLMFNMLLGTGILIGTTFMMVAVSIVWYVREEKKRSP